VTHASDFEETVREFKRIPVEVRSMSVHQVCGKNRADDVCTFFASHNHLSHDMLRSQCNFCHAHNSSSNVRRSAPMLGDQLMSSNVLSFLLEYVL
jgi:hypothetical protein